MKTTFLRTLLALVALVSSTSFAQAQQMGFGNVLGQWSGSQSRQFGSGAAQADYTESGDVEAQLANYNEAFNMGAGISGNCNTCSYDGCSCGTDCGGAGCCQAGCACGSCDGGMCGDCYGGCGDCYGAGACGDCYGCEPANYCGDCNSCGVAAGMCYAEIQNIFLRAHVNDQVVGKLREKYEWSPRAVVGYESASGLGARGRYWNYSRTTATVDDSASLRFDMDVIDVEGTTRLQSKRTDLVLSGGFRWADIEITEDDTDSIDTEMPGITFAADVRSAICGNCVKQWAGVAGARWSMLGGDWEGDTSFLSETFDDNVTVYEIYGGVEYLCHHKSCTFFTRAVFEVQNWHSDALGENSPTDSIGFVGPALHGGISY